MSKHFRFEDLKIWHKAIDIGSKLFITSLRLDSLKYFRYAEQLRAAGLSISTYIAEGSGSLTDIDFARFLGYSRKSIFECANILVVFEKQEIISQDEKLELYYDLEELSKMIFGFIKSLKSGK